MSPAANTSASDLNPAPPPAKTEHTPLGERMQSIDILRGFDMFWISGGDHLFHALATATGWAWLVMVGHQLKHTKWEGFTFYDLIMPLFLFITGITLPLSVGRRLARGQTRLEVFKRLLTRAVLLLILGHLDKNGAISLDISNLRFTSVLGRIGVAGLAAGVILMYFRTRAQIAWVIGLLVAYWALMTFIPAPGETTPSFAQGVNIVDYLDQKVMPGKLRSGNHDAIGWFSTPPAIATVLMGALAGSWLLTPRSNGRKVLGLIGGGGGLILLGWLWGFQFPIIKNLWTSSYTLYTAGWSCLLLGIFYGVVDGLQWRRWGFPFLLIGMNPLVIYLLTNTKWIDFHYIAEFFLGFTYSHASSAMIPVWQEVTTIAVQFVFLYWLYRRKFFWRV